jgi:hypothetical protein
VGGGGRPRRPAAPGGAASYFESYLARQYLADTRLRRATLDGDTGAAAEQLRAGIGLAEEALPRLDPADPFLRRRRLQTEWQLVFDRLSLERLDRDGAFPPDSAAELDG